ncbi:ABC transporter permease [Oceanibium sediminis]|uniref:ABC transporter permease n=1 Tax=Oceanibium sediminis TaxID=2026339 RepID=UPI000DD312A0|nr:ABC transporter permease [Oceanibium sediminis]
MYLLNFLIRRVLQGLVVLLIVSFAIFALLRVVPGDPARLIVGGMAPDEVVVQKAEELGLNDPIVVQYVRYLGDLARGDLGNSFFRPKSGATVGAAAYDDPSRNERAEVLDLILERIPLTLQLAGLSVVFALIISFPLGVAAGLNPGKWQDRLAFFSGSVFVSLPNFWLGIVLAQLFSIKLGILPSIGYKGFEYTILPAFVLAIGISPFIIRTLSVSIAQIMHEEFIAVAPLRGLKRPRIVVAHAIRNASIPLLNLFGIQLGILLGGVLVVELIFDYPGLGRLTINAVLQRDFPIIQGVAIFISAIFVFINIAVDLAASFIDPRLEY